MRREINIQFKLKPNRNACKAYDFEEVWLTEIFNYPNEKLLQSCLKELDKKHI